MLIKCTGISLGINKNGHRVINMVGKRVIYIHIKGKLDLLYEQRMRNETEDGIAMRLLLSEKYKCF